MPPSQNPNRPRNDEGDATLVVVFILLAIFGLFFYIAYSRLHLRASQLLELGLYPLLAGVFCFEWVRYQATKRAKLEEAWPRPVPSISERTIS